MDLSKHYYVLYCDASFHLRNFCLFLNLQMTRRNILNDDKKNPQQHPVYSDFSHIPSIGNISFAVGLRDDNAEANIFRILPLTKIQPAIKTSKPIPKKKVVKKVVGQVQVEEDPECNRSDCLARRNKLSDLRNENENLRAQFKLIENKLSAAKHKKALAEKTIANTEEKNDSIRANIDDMQNRMDAVEAEIAVGEATNSKLKQKLSVLESEIEVLRQQAEKDAEVMMSLQVASVEEMVFAPRRVMSRSERKEVEEVKSLRLNKEEENSDDD